MKHRLPLNRVVVVLTVLAVAGVLARRYLLPSTLRPFDVEPGVVYRVKFRGGTGLVLFDPPESVLYKGVTCRYRWRYHLEGKLDELSGQGTLGERAVAITPNKTVVPLSPEVKESVYLVVGDLRIRWSAGPGCGYLYLPGRQIRIEALPVGTEFFFDAVQLQ